MGYVKTSLAVLLPVVAGCAARPEYYVARTRAEAASLTAQAEAAHSGVVQLRPHVTPPGAALRQYVESLLAKLIAGARQHEDTLGSLHRQVEQLRAEKDWYVNHWWWRLWRFLRGTFGLLIGLLGLGIIARIIGVAAVGTAIGTAARWIWKTVAAALTVGISAVVDVIEFCVLWLVTLYKGKKSGRGNPSSA